MHPRIEKEVGRRALRNFYLSVDRAGVHCPKWALVLKRDGFAMRKAFLKVYRRSIIKAMFSRYGTRFHVDHIIPLHGANVSGLHVPWNLHVIPAVVNMAKGTMVVPDYLDRDSVTTGRQHKQRVAANKDKRFDEFWMRTFDQD